MQISTPLRACVTGWWRRPSPSPLFSAACSGTAAPLHILLPPTGERYSLDSASAVEMSEARSSPAPAALPDNDDMLVEILLRLPPLPSSLPRASLVCKRWRRLISDPQFVRRFRAHHRRPPLLGFFYDGFTGPVFVPMLDRPDRIPRARFRLPQHEDSHWEFLGCRHGLAAILNLTRMEAVVWDPVTGGQMRIAFPLEANFRNKRYHFSGGVMSATNDYCGYVRNYPHLSPFRLVLLCNNGNLVCACVYESESNKWGNVGSIAIPARSDVYYRSVLIENALYWFLVRDWDCDILMFDLETQRLTIILKPEDAHFTPKSFFRVLRTEDRGLCLAIMSGNSMQL